MTDIFLYTGELQPADVRLRGLTSAGFVNLTGVPLHAGGAAPRPRVVYYQSSFVPLYVAPAGAAYTNVGWYAPLSPAPAVAKAQAGYPAFVPYNTAQLSVNFSNFGWHPPTSTAAPVARAQLGSSSVPFNTAQLSVNFTTTGWESQPPAAPPVAKAQQGNSFVPFNTVQTQYAANYTNLGWYAPLATPSPVAKPQLGFPPFVPYNTAQVAAAPTVTLGLPLYAGGAAPRTRRVYYQARFETPYPVVSVVTPAVYGWWNPLWTAPRVARAIQGNAFVPFNPPPVYGVQIDLGGDPPRQRQVYYQARFEVPYPVVQVIIPPVVPPVVEPPDALGGTTSIGGGGGFCRKKWKHLLDEIRQQLADEAASLKAAKKRKDDLEYARRLARIAALHDRALGLASGCAPQATQSINTLLDKIDRVEAAYQEALAREEDDEEVILVMLH